MNLIPSLAACLVLAMAAFGVSAAAAQDATPNAGRDANQDQDARAHFRRAIERFNEENYDAALAEFQRAYAIDPANAILYNIARVYAGQGNAVEAARNYERYL
ncbi:MAG: tetratricopeptide repeat protein, partial [Deltaproteobacteria bacterium]|nr:tetratricopeptide repeat protein [Deltaproteobacteria bacterium]